jgi:hypothetical protein
MVRLLVIFAPAFAIIASIGIVATLKPFFTLLQETSHTMVKSKRKLARVSKEYSGVVILIVFLLLMSNLAFSPQSGGMPRSIEQAYMPTAISSSSIPIGGTSLSAPVSAWLDAVQWTKTTLKPTDVVAMWWDYGNWLADLGNVTSLADNTTVNATQIENIGFAFMGNEKQTLTMLSTYGQDRLKYIAVFEVLYVAQTNTGSQWVATSAGYGDEGKWVWMARISGQGKDRLIKQNFISEADAWVNETSFGSSNSQTGRWEWNPKGLNSTIFKLLNYAEVQYATRMSIALSSQSITISPEQTGEAPTYFKEAYFAGFNVSPYQYGGLVPVVAIYEIDWAKWNADNP